MRVPVEIRIVRSRNEYLPLVDGIARLFRKSFRREFPEASWGQYYLNHPLGSPLVGVAMVGGEVVGHHALVPAELCSGRGERKTYLHSMSLMVDEDFRGEGVFMQLLEATHAAAEETEAEWILGFPNENSAKPLRAFFGHKLLLETPLLTWEMNEGGEEAEIQEQRYCPKAGLDEFGCCGDGDYWNWRTKLNGARSVVLNRRSEVVFRPSDADSITVLDFRTGDALGGRRDLQALMGRTRARSLRITEIHARQAIGVAEEAQPHKGYRLRLMGRALKSELPKVRLSLLMSDVF